MALTSSDIAYRRRLRVSAVLSLLLHGAFVAVVALNPGACQPTDMGFVDDEAPLVVNLQPREAQERKRLIEPAVPSTELPDDTDLIAESNAQAQDTQDSQGDELTPDLPEIAEFDRLGGQPSPSPELIPVAPQPPAADETTDDEPADDKVTVEPEPELAPIDLAKRESTREPAEDAEQEQADVPKETTPALPQPFDMARADSIPIPGPDDGAPRARKPGGVEAEGFANFEAKQHEMAPYLKTIREKVEREWRAALQMRYTGTTPTKAVIQCDINSKGEIVNVEIVEPGSSVSYGPLCKDAIQRAGPFGPFPFDVPAIYQNQNLEIRWTFSFM